jgi:hypothetical protein
VTKFAQRNFAGGEIAPALYARCDTVKFATGLRTLRNFLIMRHGGAANRPGTEFVCETKDSSKTIRLIPFCFNSDQTYILEFGNQYMRVIRDGAQLTQTPQNITGITNANPAVVTYAGADNYANGDYIYISGITGAIGTYLNGRNFRVAGVNTGANTFQLHYVDGTNVNSTSMGSYTSGGTVAEIYEISTPWATAELDDMQFVQSADVITIVHPLYAPRELSRTGHTSWSIRTVDFTPGGLDGVLNAFEIFSVTGTAGANSYYYAAVLVNDQTGEEAPGYVTKSQAGLAAATAAAPHVLTFDGAPDGWSTVRVYRSESAGADIYQYGYIGTANASSSFRDYGISPDYSNIPTEARDPFNAADDYPAVIAYAQQRLLLANTTNNPEGVWASQPGRSKNFCLHTPLRDDDAVTFRISGKQVNSVKHIVDLGKPVIFTDAGEWVVGGNEAGILTPDGVNPKQQSYNGAGDLPPIVIGGTALYVQARGSVVRDLGFDFQSDGYRGNDLTLYAAHLFDGYQLSDWAFQKIPHSVVWVAREDGVLLGLTYIPEQQIWGWHRHDLGEGLVENVCTVPEGDEDALYLVVNRTVNGITQRYIERMVSRNITDLIDAVIMDCSLGYDGRNTGSQTMTLSGGTDWVYTETLTLTSSSSYFTSAEVGNAIDLDLYDADGEFQDRIRLTIVGYTSGTVVTCTPDKTVPAGLRSVAVTTWTRAVDSITGLWHLEGEDVAVLADGYVKASPNNPDYEIITVTNGGISLNRPYGVIRVGLPYTCDIETLNIDIPQGETLTGARKNVGKVHVKVENSRGGFVGYQAPTDDSEDALENLNELKIRGEEDNYGLPELLTDDLEIVIQPNWNSNGRVFIRQVDPLPLTVLAIYPEGVAPVGRQ